MYNSLGRTAKYTNKYNILTYCKLCREPIKRLNIYFYCAPTKYSVQLILLYLQ